MSIFPVKAKFDRLINRYIDRFSSDDGEQLLWGLDNNYENHTRYAWHHGRIFQKEDIYPLRECIYENLICYSPSRFEKYVFAEYGMRYLDMPDVLGVSAHFDQYFSGIDLPQAYQELIKSDITMRKKDVLLDEAKH